MNILITGISGFVGRNLLQKIGTEDNMIFSDEGDLSQEGTLNRLDPYHIKHIFHLASLINIKESWQNPYKYYQNNILSTINVLEFARKHNCNVTFMSSYVYGEPDYIPVDEKHPVKIFNPYCHTKICSESICNMYAKSFGLTVTIFRAFNIYGKGQTSLLVPMITDMLFSKLHDEIEVPNDAIIRDFINIDDVITALVSSINGPGGIYNLASGKGISVGEIINKLSAITGIQKPIKLKSRGIENEISSIVADISKIKKELNWAPKIDMGTGLKDYIEWYNDTHGNK